jgi:hypothetical protein
VLFSDGTNIYMYECDYYLDLQECLRVHHPDSSDDEDVAPRRRRAPRTAPMAEED